jgi:hypothetical protein
MSDGVLKLARQVARRQGDTKFVACTSKRKFGSERDARRVLKKMKGQKGVSRRESLVVYACDFCGRYHVGPES